MKPARILINTMVLLCALFFPADPGYGMSRALIDMPASAANASPRGRAVIANLGSGTISVIDADTYEVVDTYALPAGPGERQPEPVYVVSVPRYRRAFVNDRANNRIVALDDRDFHVVGTVPMGQSTFPHMWADLQGRQVWVTNDLESTIVVFDPRSLALLATVRIPAELEALGGRPHDVILDARGRYAYVSLLGVSGEHDYVLQYDTSTFEELRRAPVGKEPHLSLARQGPWLYVPCQASGTVLVLDLETLELHTARTLPRAHGIAAAPNGQYVYISSVPSYDPVPPNGGVYTLDARRDQVVGEPVPSPYPFPHNLAVSRDGGVLFLTHSGPTQNKVSIYEIRYPEARPSFVTEVTVGLNPFGLAFMP